MNNIATLERLLEKLRAKKMYAGERSNHWSDKGETDLADWWLGQYSGLAKAMSYVQSELDEAHYDAQMRGM